MSLRVVNKLLNRVKLGNSLSAKYFYTSKTVETTTQPQQEAKKEDTASKPKEYKMDKFKANPYFSKYEAKLKAVYEYEFNFSYLLIVVKLIVNL
jgi:hypothetical protein